ncbi:EAL domain-containing protein [Desulfovibrio aerotolerans]|uniref:EAL domain-containing protein n=1 Tax=Solidesulfovibrio aerotolerans TaxID=295255 RepID=A0A7C9IWY7_9BACT|nr:EAL domain-containing protein [Solidesulfovibrio aerotolerans]MYL83822.1 EAL domain-containing protein [Solidesulfovibrio aerotolerans]
MRSFCGFLGQAVGRSRQGLAAKLLLPALSLSLGVGLLLFLFFSEKFARQAEEDLRNRLDSFLSTQAAELEGPVWEFDQAAIDRLFRSYALMPDLQRVRLTDSQGATLALAGADPSPSDRTFAASRRLTRQAGSETYNLGRLEVVFNDSRIRQGLAASRKAELPAALGLAVLFAGVLVVTVHWHLGVPLRRLRESLERNAAAGLRSPLPWQSRDELGQVVDAYNAMLAEVNQYTGSLELANAELQAENLQRRLAETRLTLFKTMVEATDTAMVITDRELRVQETNAACLRLTGFAAEELAGRPVWETFLFPHDRDRMAAVQRCLEANAAWAGEWRGLTSQGARLPLRVTINALHFSGDAAAHHVLVFTDISEQKATQKLLKSLAYSDSLTGLPNRALFMDRLEREICIETRRGRGFALLFVDLDNFKWINDSMSHAVGDRVLAALAGRMRQCLRAEDTLARMGGDEFTVILRETGDAVVVERVVAALLARMAEPLEVDGATLEIGASIGAALYPNDGAASETLMKNADTAMYAAKAAGGSRLRFFEPAIAQKAQARLNLRNKLKRAIARREFVLHFQPIVAMATGAHVHYEALVRWNRPKALVQPAQFIEFAENEGLINHIGRQVFDMAFAQLRDWAGEGVPATMAVNVSRSQFLEEDFVEDLLARATRHGVAPSRMVLEITESLLITDSAAAKVVLARLIASGFRIAVDDFGVGYSSLSVLVEYPVQIVKLDKSLIRPLECDPRARAMVSGFIALFQSLGLEVVAEGVETAVQHEFLAAAGCNLGQGWLYGKPMPATPALAAASAMESRLVVSRLRDKDRPVAQ